MSIETPAGVLTLSQLPLFPLQTVLFPGGWMPLRIFEVRYLDMISRCHKADAPFGVVCLRKGSEVRRIDPSAPDGMSDEVFFETGTIARIEQISQPQPGLLFIHCKGQQRFRISSSQRLLHGLWVADVKLDEKEPLVTVPEHLASTRDGLKRLLLKIQESAQPSANELPMQPPYEWDNSGWVANRWAELLPIHSELKQQLMMLDNPMLRLELISDLLDKLGL